MKNIGILTYHCIPNFGAQLQVLSTVGYLRRYGYNPVVLNWFPKDLEEYYRNRVPNEQYECQYDFSQNQMPVSRLCRTQEELAVEISRLSLDGIIIGSDALFDYIPESWRYNISLRRFKKMPIFVTSNHRLPNPFWGSFNDFLKESIPFVGFSISSQNMPYRNLNKKEIRELKRLLLQFRYLTVRDRWTKDSVKYISGREVSITPDPVFSFNDNLGDEITKQEICEKFKLPDNYILVSFLNPLLSDDFVNNIIGLLESKTCSKCVSFPMPDILRRFKTEYCIKQPLNPKDWYYLIKYSNGYIGERMHPIIVSLHNSVPFYCFDQYGAKVVIIPRIWSVFKPKSSKIYDILDRAGFLDNMCFFSKIHNLTPERVVEKFLAFDRGKCERFSKQMLEEYNKGMDRMLTELGV